LSCGGPFRHRSTKTVVLNNIIVQIQENELTAPRLLALESPARCYELERKCMSIVHLSTKRMVGKDVRNIDIQPRFCRQGHPVERWDQAVTPCYDHPS
jgi:hypothetical protein